MNIFVTSEDPEECAKALDDAILNNSLDVMAQLLGSVAYFVYGQERVYIHVDMSHPCILWVRRSDENFIWTARYYLFMIAEYKHRFNREHHTHKVISPILSRCFAKMKDVREPTSFCNKAEGYPEFNPITAYRYYLSWRWKLVPSVWTNREEPKWFRQ